VDAREVCEALAKCPLDLVTNGRFYELHDAIEEQSVRVWMRRYESACLDVMELEALCAKGGAL
jgi:hypothetical protein